MLYLIRSTLQHKNRKSKKQKQKQKWCQRNENRRMFVCMCVRRQIFHLQNHKSDIKHNTTGTASYMYTEWSADRTEIYVVILCYAISFRFLLVAIARMRDWLARKY